MILALNGVPLDGFGEFGAASSAIAGLQTALKGFGQSVGDTVLRAIVVDGLIGPKTVAAANRALRQHIGAGQAPQDLRTGVLTQAQVVTNAAQITQLVNAEATRRGFDVFVGPVALPKKAVATYIPPRAPASYTPAYAPSSAAPIMVPSTKTYVVPSSAAGGGMDIESIMKWSAIGLGVVGALGAAYYFMTRRQGSPAMAGLGAGGFYHTNPSEFTPGQRVQLHPGLDLWMRGARYGTVKKIGRDRVHVELDATGKTVGIPAMRLQIED